MARVNIQGQKEDETPIGEFNVSEFAAANNLKLLGTTPTGNYLIETTDGDQGEFNPQEYLVSQGIENPNRMLIQANDSNTAFQQVPPSFREDSGLLKKGTQERFLSSLGNQKGTMKRLQSQFGKDNVKINAYGEITIKENGDWYSFDPAGLGIGSTSDKAWELAGEVADNFNDFVVRGAAAVKGAAVGAAAGSAFGGVGAIPGALIGAGIGGLTAEVGTRQILGRVAGTYEATAEESLQDIGFETLMATGGQAVAMGARPALSQVVKAGKYIGSKASTGTKAIASEVYGFLNGTGIDATRTLFDKADDVGRIISSTTKKVAGGTYDDFAAALKLKQVETVKNVMDGFEKSVSTKYKTALSGVFKKSKNLKVNFTNMIDDVVKEAEEQGLIQVTRKGGLIKSIRPSGADLADPEVAKPTARALNSILNFQRKGTLTGEEAAETLWRMNKGLNSAAKNAFSAQQSAAGGAFKQTAGKIRTNIGKIFDKVGMADEYTKAQQVWVDNIGVLEKIRKLGKSEELVENFVNKLSQSGRRNVTAKEMFKNMGKFIGPKGEKLVEDLDLYHSALMYGKWLPHMGLLQGLGVTGATSAALSGGIGTVGGGTFAAAATQISPRFVARQTQVIYGAKELLRNMGPKQLDILLQDPDKFAALVQIVRQAPQIENAAKEKLMKFMEQSVNEEPRK